MKKTERRKSVWVNLGYFLTFLKNKTAWSQGKFSLREDRKENTISNNGAHLNCFIAHLLSNSQSSRQKEHI